MKTALVLGISGGFGGSTARALARDGWRIRALMRDPSRLPTELHGAEVIAGDALDVAAVRRAAQGAELIVYGVNPPGYRWQGVALPMLEASAAVAEEMALTIVFPGNTYVLDPADGPEFSEQAPVHPVSSKGRMRQAMEERLRTASERGAQVIVLRAGDFIGRTAPSAWMGVLLKPTRDGFALSTPGPRDLEHSWAYLPDVARVAATLAARRKELPAWNVFHFRGYRMSFNDIAAALRQASGRPVRLKGFPWLAVRMMAPFSALYGGLTEMRYLWRRTVNLDDTKLRTFLGEPVPHTPFAEALRQLGLAPTGANAAAGSDAAAWD